MDRVSEDIEKWFRRHQRDLPWRHDPSPYTVWVSEVMLQQTRVEVVIPYFLRWIERFPTLTSLAQGTEDEVIKLWEGLGYYSRARNLYRGAQEVEKKYGGVLPIERDQLLQIKGIGPYTAGAILSFAFHKKAAALDGNVVRVIARYTAFTQDVSKGEKELRQRVEDVLPEKNPQVVMEGLIELGALVCQKRPKCSLCPLEEGCLAKKKGVEELLPKLPKRRETIELKRFVACIEREGSFLLKKNGKGEIMEGLWEFPYIEQPDNLKRDSQQQIEDLFGIKLALKKALPQHKHSFTRYRVVLFPNHFTTTATTVIGYEWVSKKGFTEIPFSSGHFKISRDLLKEE